MTEPTRQHSYHGTPLRPVRIEDELWDAAKTAAMERNETVSEVIRRQLAEYVASHEAETASKQHD